MLTQEQSLRAAPPAVQLVRPRSDAQRPGKLQSSQCRCPATLQRAPAPLAIRQVGSMRGLATEAVASNLQRS